MSAFLCSDTHTLALALWSARQDPTQPPQTADVIKTAKALRKLNNYALACRYGDAPEYLPRDPMPALADAVRWLDEHNAADVAQAAHCFRYQCSEGDTDTNPKWLPLWRMVQHITDRADAAAVGLAKSPVWSI